MKKYLLPCACGKEIEVDSTQCGLKVRCGCGADVEVPTMRGLQQLRSAETSAPAARQSNWGPRQGLLFLATVVLVISVPIAGWIYINRPVVDMQIPLLRSQMEQLSPANSWHVWEEVRKGIFVDEAFESQVQTAMGMYHRDLGLALGGVAVGVLLIVAAFFVSTGRASGAPPARPRPPAKAGAAR
jgi:hypothetical protein